MEAYGTGAASTASDDGDPGGGCLFWAYAFSPTIVRSPILLYHRYALALAVFFGGFVLARRHISPLWIFYGMCALIYSYRLI